jgi:hypothetical protein
LTGAAPKSRFGVVFRFFTGNFLHGTILEADDDMDVAQEAVAESLDTSEDDILLKDEPRGTGIMPLIFAWNRWSIRAFILPLTLINNLKDDEAAEAALEAELSPNDHLALKDEDTLKDYDTRSEVSDTSRHSITSGKKHK